MAGSDKRTFCPGERLWPRMGRIEWEMGHA
ncbi:hypothetical protein AvCA_11030 [Azotobacter vinelandii CA]|uniref:Uncharacterized protein n=2 Tax=Azotobacter vinelandii TaxID=354 RepID=C1DPA2_AZOVD|nr:hypothetical protein Avin_11030 [Azotobacter vinelandii DJ]AGK17087.1 hypothetical protein AvCA_11030 [Azotobacter vinelandii CA]AGK19727.1 hypothetical protein AvCA6_11030 [Azotobacter vinelandii CA6]